MPATRDRRRAKQRATFPVSTSACSFSIGHVRPAGVDRAEVCVEQPRDPLRARADHGQKDLALGQTSPQLSGELFAQFDVSRIAKYRARAESLRHLLVDEHGGERLITSTEVDENGRPGGPFPGMSRWQHIMGAYKPWYVRFRHRQEETPRVSIRHPPLSNQRCRDG
jgi:hypothetical protein